MPPFIANILGFFIGFGTFVLLWSLTIGGLVFLNFDPEATFAAHVIGMGVVTAALIYFSLAYVVGGLCAYKLKEI